MSCADSKTLPVNIASDVAHTVQRLVRHMTKPHVEDLSPEQCDIFVQMSILCSRFQHYNHY